jgi:hypothetical protein
MNLPLFLQTVSVAENLWHARRSVSVNAVFSKCPFFCLQYHERLRTRKIVILYYYTYASALIHI